MNEVLSKNFGRNWIGQSSTLIPLTRSGRRSVSRLRRSWA